MITCLCTIIPLHNHTADAAVEAKTTHPKDLRETIAKLEAADKRSRAKWAELDALKRIVVEKYIAEYCSELYPNGYKAARGGYWFVPAPSLIKISYATGFVFNQEDPGRQPMRTDAGRNMDVIDLWRYRKDVTFGQSVRDIRLWVQQREQGIPALPLPQKDHDGTMRTTLT